MQRKILSFIQAVTLLTLSYGSSVYAVNIESPEYDLSCAKGSQLYLARSAELQTLVKADQADREKWQTLSEKDFQKLARRDLVRRKRVGEIFAEGCLEEPKDYLAAALIYQHGNAPDHYYQAFIWSKRAAELGDASGQSFSALAIDRYLINTGRKQLFGSQYQKSLTSHCYCMQPVESSFPDDFRKKYSGRSLEDNYKIMSSINEKDCPTAECPEVLQDTPKGSVVGLW